MFILANEFRCLSNALIQAGLNLLLPVTFHVPPRARELVREAQLPASKVRQVRLHQCPQAENSVLYRVEVEATDGRQWDKEFVMTTEETAHDTFVLYDRDRDGILEYLHVLH